MGISKFKSEVKSIGNSNYFLIPAYLVKLGYIDLDFGYELSFKEIKKSED